MAVDPNQTHAALSAASFFETLVLSGLFHEAELIEVRERLGPDADAQDATTLSARLVREGVLTEFQAACLAIGKYDGLVYGRYAVLERIGAGAMGLVYKGRHRLMDRIVALKMVSTQPKSVKDSVARFFREMKIVGRLDHPNVVRAYDADVCNGRPYIVMEYLEGEDFEKYLERHGPLPPDEVIGLAEQVAWGLAHAHEKGILHRDIKPTNLFREKSGVVKILDLGLGAFVENAGDGAHYPEASNGKVMGTADYMSPEQVSGQAIDTRTDLFSLGCTIYRLLTGAHAFPGPTRDIRLTRRLRERYHPITEVRPNLPYGIVQILDLLLATRPDDRFASASEAAEALGSLLHRTPSGTARRQWANPRTRRAESAAPDRTPVPDGPELNWSLIETALKPAGVAQRAEPPAPERPRPAPARAAESASLATHRKNLEAESEESGREVHHQYRKELIQLNRAIADDQAERQQPRDQPETEGWVERVGERIGDFLGEPDASHALVVVLLGLVILAAAMAIALN
ncbi:MAG: serine/threonine-protein kinase [Isosphaeraceae bacterium]